MDLVAGVKRVVEVLEHVATAKDGSTSHKILPKCELPLTGVGVVDRIITDLRVMGVSDTSLKLVELAPGVAKEQVIATIDLPLAVAGLNLHFVRAVCAASWSAPCPDDFVIFDFFTMPFFATRKPRVTVPICDCLIESARYFWRLQVSKFATASVSMLAGLIGAPHGRTPRRPSPVPGWESPPSGSMLAYRDEPIV